MAAMSEPNMIRPVSSDEEGSSSPTSHQHGPTLPVPISRLMTGGSRDLTSLARLPGAQISYT